MPFTLIIQYRGLIQLLAIFAFILILILAVSILKINKGIVIDQGKLYIGYFSWNKLFFKDPVEINNQQIITILRYKRRERGVYRSIANPEFTTSFNTFEIYLLNDKHTVKRKIITLKNEYKANAALDFIIKNSSLEHQIYSPDFS